MLTLLLFACFCLGILVGRVVPSLVRRIRNYLYVPHLLRAYQPPSSSDLDQS